MHGMLYGKGSSILYCVIRGRQRAVASIDAFALLSVHASIPNYQESEMKSSSTTRRQSPATATVSPDTNSDDRDYSKPAIQYHDVTAAAYRIRKGVKETPLEVCLVVNIVAIMLVSCVL